MLSKLIGALLAIGIFIFVVAIQTYMPEKEGGKKEKGKNFYIKQAIIALIVLIVSTVISNIITDITTPPDTPIPTPTDTPIPTPTNTPIPTPPDTPIPTPTDTPIPTPTNTPTPTPTDTPIPTPTNTPIPTPTDTPTPTPTDTPIPTPTNNPTPVPTPTVSNFSVSVSYSKNPIQISPQGVDVLITAETSSPATSIIISFLTGTNDYGSFNMYMGIDGWWFNANFYERGTFTVIVTAYSADGQVAQDTFEYIY